MQTYQKRQKELARQQKQRDKAARRQERKANKIKGGPPLEGADPITGSSICNRSQVILVPAIDKCCCLGDHYSAFQ